MSGRSRFIGEEGYKGFGPGAPIMASVQDLANQFYSWTDTMKDNLRGNLGLINKQYLTATDDDLVNAWAGYVQQSANYVANGQSLSPWDILQKDIAAHGSQSKAGTKTQTTTDTNLTSRIDADAIFQSAAKSLLGRNPTSTEAAAFYNTLNANERANPTTATTTSEYDEEGNVVSSSRTSEGGLGAGGAALLAQKQAESNPEYAQYQAATTYYNAALETIMRGY